MIDVGVFTILFGLVAAIAFYIWVTESSNGVVERSLLQCFAVVLGLIIVAFGFGMAVAGL